MKTRFGSKLIIVVATLAFLLMQSGAVLAYTIDWMSIQHRVYENGNQFNRLALEIKDDSNAYITSETAITNVVLKDANGNSLQLEYKYFDYFDYISAKFDTTFYSWIIGSPFKLSDISYDILDPLAVGQYTVEVTMDDGSVLTQTIDYANKMDLAFVPSSTFQIRTDSKGNIFWTWDTPSELLTTAQTTNISIRAGLSAYSNGKTIALYWPAISIEMGHCFIPNYIYQDFVSKADEIVFGLQVRTNDNQSRAYSNSVSVTDLSNPVSVSAGSSGVTLNSDLSFYLPNAALATPTGNVYLDIDFSYFGQSGNGELLWTLGKYSVK